MIVLDTNVLSEPMRERPDVGVLAWLDGYRIESAYFTAISLAELRVGALRLENGAKKSRLLRQIDVLAERFTGRILPFDQATTPHYAALCDQRARLGRPISIPDAQIAAICRQHGASLATRNMKDFLNTGITLHDPWADRSIADA